MFDQNFKVYGARKVWRQLVREGHDVARCTVERLMKRQGLQGAIRGKPVKTTIGDKAVPCPLDRVNRQFGAPAPNRLWLSDFTYVATWAEFVYVAFVIDAFARRIVGWRVASAMVRCRIFGLLFRFRGILTSVFFISRACAARTLPAGVAAPKTSISRVSCALRSPSVLGVQFPPLTRS